MNGYACNDMNNSPYIVDLRSDTISRPSQAMREAMKNAIVGDDVYGEDPTVKTLEERTAELLGKETALFVPSGTMANLIAVMVHCNQRGVEMIAGDKSHIYWFEQGGASCIANVLLTTISNNIDGTFDLGELKSKIRTDPDYHEAKTVLCCIENTHNMCGGKVLPIEWINKLTKICKSKKVAVHMDGARLFNAAVASKISAKDIVSGCDSVSVCLSKSLGAPIGSLLVGRREFIDKARRIRKLLGGGMRQSGVIAAAGLIALNEMIDRLAEDHLRAHMIAQALNSANSPFFNIDEKSVHTNIFMMYINTNKIKAADLIERLNTVSDEEREKGLNVVVKLCSRSEEWVRFTLYYEITDRDVELTIKKLLFVIKEYEQKYLNV